MRKTLLAHRKFTVNLFGRRFADLRRFLGRVEVSKVFPSPSEAYSDSPFDASCKSDTGDSAGIVASSPSIARVLGVRTLPQILAAIVQRVVVFVVHLLIDSRPKDNPVHRNGFAPLVFLASSQGIETFGVSLKRSEPFPLVEELKISNIHDGVLTLRQRNKAVGCVRWLRNGMPPRTAFLHKSSSKGFCCAAILALFLLLAPVAFSQSTSVSGQITDSGSQAWSNGTFAFSFVPNPQYPASQYTWTGGAFNVNQPITGSLSSSGTYSVSIPSNTAITPVNSQWLVKFCPQANPAQCYTTAPVTITGSTQTLNATPPAIQVQPGILSVAYSDSEIIGFTEGSIYWNLTIPALRIYDQGAWVTAGGGGGGGGTVTNVSCVSGCTVANPTTTPAITVTGGGGMVYPSGTGIPQVTGGTAWGTTLSTNGSGAVCLVTGCAAVLTNATGLPLTTGVAGILPVANGGNGTATPALVAGTNVTITGSWPALTINASGTVSTAFSALTPGTNTNSGFITAPTSTSTIPWIWGCPLSITVDCYDWTLNGSKIAYIDSNGHFNIQTLNLPGTTTDSILYGNSTSAVGQVTPPAGPGIFTVGYAPTTSTPIAPTTFQVGVCQGGGPVTGSTATYTVAYTDVGCIVNHAQAATASVNVTLPTATTLNDPTFGMRWCNQSTHADTITPTTWTIQVGDTAAGATAPVAAGTCILIWVDPGSTTNWLAAGGTSGGGSGNTTSTTLTTNALPKANGANSIINSLFTDTGSIGTYAGIFGMDSTYGFYAGGGSGTQAGVFAAVGGTTTPASIAVNSIALFGPNSNSFTSYGLQFPATAPTNGQTVVFGTPSGGIVPITYGAGGSGLSGQTTGCLPLAASATTSTSSSSVCDNGTTVSTPEPVTVGASIATTSDGVHAGQASLPGNTTLPTCPTNDSCVIGPPSATPTGMSLQLPSTVPPTTDLLSCVTSGKNCLLTPVAVVGTDAGVASAGTISTTAGLPVVSDANGGVTTTGGFSITAAGTSWIGYCISCFGGTAIGGILSTTAGDPNLWLFNLPYTAKVTIVNAYVIATSASTTGDVGMYSSSGSLLWHTGGFSTATANLLTCYAQTPATTTCSSSSGTAYTMTPGQYYLASCDTSVTPSLLSLGSYTDMNALMGSTLPAHSWGTDTTDTCSTGVLPSTITPANIANSNISGPHWLKLSN